jgi:glycosyltransferase involved in cell wall biosynthesis
MKKILFIGPEQGDHLYNCIRPFLNKYEIGVATLHQDTPLPGTKRFPLKNYTGSRIDFALNIPVLRDAVKNFKPDLIHVHFLSSYGVMAAWIKTPEIPLVLSILGSDVNKTKSLWLMKKICQWAIRKYNFVNSPSHAIEKVILDWGVKSDRIDVFQYGINTKKIRPKNTFQISSPTQLISFRDWAPLYQIDKIVSGFHQAWQDNSNMKLHLLGRRTAQQEDVIRKAIDNGPAREAIVVHDFLPPQKLFELFSQMDIFFSVPIMDGMPLSLLEGLYMGFYPILSDIPPNREWMENDDIPWISKWTKDEIAAAISSAILACSDIKNLELKIEKWRKKVIQEGDFETNMEKMEKHYERLIKK